MSSWPSSLPQDLLLQGYSEALPDLVITSSMDVGPPKRRRRALNGPANIAGQQIMTRAEWATLKAFYVNDLGAGALTFDWVHPVEGHAVTLAFRSPPARTPVSTELYAVVLQLEIQ